MKRFHTALLLMLMSATLASAQQVINLWPNGAPNSNGNDEADKAELTVFLPDKKKATGRAIVCCPGGAYSHLAMQHEGTDWQWFFTNQGIALFVLKYRMPHGNFKVPLSDAEEAIKTVRRHAREWHINPKAVGIMGFSAGGHLASTIATHSKQARPDFQVLFYPVITMVSGFTHKGSHDNFLGSDLSKKQLKKLEQEYSSDMQVTRATPPAFIALSDDDQGVLPSNGVNYYMECFRHDVPATLHVYPKGGHGWGYRESFPYHMEMLLDLKAWLQSF